MRIATKIRCTVVPLFLCVVASVHIVRYYCYDQSSWGAGCGFGMFATVDYHGTRFFRGYLRSGDVEHPAGFRSDFADVDMHTRVLPTSTQLRQYASTLLNADWMIRDRSELMPVSTAPAAPQVEQCFALLRERPAHRSVDVDQVRLQVWGIRFEPRSKSIEAYPIREVEVREP